MNKVILIGRLAKDPELKYTPGNGTAVTNITIAVDRRKKGEADFLPVIIWGKSAEATANYMTKGRSIGIAGRIQTRSYDAKDGTKRYVTEIIAEEVQFLDKGNSNNNGNNNGNNNNNNNNNNNYNNNNNDNGNNNYNDYNNYGDDITPVDEDEIPF